MEREEFEELVAEAIDQIPKEYLEKLDNVAFVVEEYPSPEQVEKLQLRNRTSLLGLYEGVSLLSRGANYTAVMPDKITIFQKPLELYATDRQSLIKAVQETVKHEIAHHFGMSEEEVRKAEAKHK